MFHYKFFSQHEIDLLSMKSRSTYRFREADDLQSEIISKITKFFLGKKIDDKILYIL